MNDIEEHFYETAAREVASNQVVPGLMARSFSECDGDEKKTIARYIKYRAVQLHDQYRDEFARRLMQERARQKDEAQRRKDEEKLRKAEERRSAEQERLQQTLLPSERLCPHCDTKYRPDDYRSDAITWYCSLCQHPLPRT